MRPLEDWEVVEQSLVAHARYLNITWCGIPVSPGDVNLWGSVECRKCLLAGHEGGWLTWNRFKELDGRLGNS